MYRTVPRQRTIAQPRDGRRIDLSQRNYWTQLQRRRISRRSVLAATARAGVGAAGLALVGCGDDDDDAQPAAAQAQQQAVAPAPFADVDLDAHITTAVACDGGGLDPIRSGSHVNYVSHGNVYDAGIAFDPDNNDVLPHMVALEYVGDTTIVAAVQPARFHDGSILTAEDMVFTYERMGNVAEYHQGGETTDHPAGWTSARTSFGSQNWVLSEAVDERTWRIELNAPNAAWAAAQMPNSSTVGAIFSKAYVESVGDAALDREPMGTGPYRFVSHADDTDFVMTRFDDHLLPLDHPVNVKHVPFHKDLTVLEDGSPNPFLDIRVREAANIAVNRKAIQDNLLTGTEKQPLYTGSTSFGYPSDEEIEAAGLMFDHDPERARQLMAEAGYADGFDTTLHVVAGFAPGIAEMALAVQQDLGAIGIRLTIKEYPASQYFTDAGVRGAGSGKTDGGPGIWWFFAGFRPDVATDTNISVLPEGVYTTAPPSEEIVELARAQAQELDPVKRSAMISELFIKHTQGYYMLFLTETQNASVARADIRWPAGAVQPRGQEQLFAVQKLKDA